MDREQWVDYVNRHIDPDSDLPRISVEDLERWERLKLLVPPSGGYRRIDLERTLALLMLERALAVKFEVEEHLR